MNTSLIRIFCLGSSLLALAVGPAVATEDQLQIWSDPVFQKTFLRSYGVETEIEPPVTTVEREQMEKLLPLLSENKLEEAEKQLLKLTKPEANAVFFFTLGNIYFQQEKWTVAIDAYRKAVGNFPKFRRAWRNLGIIQVKREEYKDAIVSFGHVLEQGGNDAVTYGLLGHAYANTEQFLAAELAFRNAMLLQAESLDWRLGLARALFRQQKFAEAATLCEELLKKHPERAEFWLLQANAWLGLKEPLKAAANYEVLARLGQATAASQNTLGDIYVNENAFSLAATAYLKALELDTHGDVKRPLRNIEVLAARAALGEAKQLISRLQALHGAKLEQPERQKLLKLEARIAVAGGQGSEAAQVLQQIVKLDPLDGEALLLLGQHHARTGQPEQAVFYYERAANLEKFEADAKLRHGQLLVSTAKYAEAVPLLRRAQELSPKEAVARYLEQVERLAKSRR